MGRIDTIIVDARDRHKYFLLLKVLQRAFIKWSATELPLQVE